MLFVLNFSHPLTAEHLAQVEALAGQGVERVIDVPVQVDHDRSLADQMATVAERVGLLSVEWQTLPLVVILPGYAPAAAVLLAELHGRAGNFAAILRLRPVAGSTPTRYEAAEVLNLQDVRDAARRER